MASIQPAKVTVQQLGREKEPLVIIDGFTGAPERLCTAAQEAEYRDPGASYPGIRAWADPSYLDIRRDLMMQIMQRVFGFRRGVSLEVSTFSLVTCDPADLSDRQRIPHYDHDQGDLIAVMHYLCDKESGGTAFYRHRRTGFEAITPARQAAYNAAQGEDEREFGAPPPGYCYGDSDRYELIGEVEARPDRLALYRGRLLHSGVISRPDELSPDPAKGRLTVNMFLRGA